jgi:hypothetical protein
VGEDHSAAISNAMVPIAQITLIIDTLNHAIEYETNRHHNSVVVVNMIRAKELLIMAYRFAEARYQRSLRRQLSNDE